MAEKKVSIRLGIVGGQEVTAEFDQIGQKGAGALNRIGAAANTAGQQVTRSTGAMRSAFQNTGYQVQDFAVQVAGGTSATRALAQQLPQLLSGFGLWGVVLGTVAAIAVPLIGYFWKMGDNAQEASKKVGKLAGDVAELKGINASFTTDGIEKLIDRYGALDAKVMSLISHQRQFAVDKAMKDAKDATTELSDGLSGVRDLVTKIADIDAGKAMRGAALSALDLKDTAAELQSEFGLTVDQAKGIVQALDDARKANSLGDMADATARLTALLEGSKLKGGEFAGILIDAEGNLRALNNEASKTGGWLAVAADWASGLAARLWDGAKAAAAIRDAQATADSPLARHTRMVAAMEIGGKGRGLTPSSAGPTAHSSDGTVIDLNPPTTGGGTAGAGGGTSAAAKARNDLEQQAKAIYDSTRTSAEKYRSEMEQLNAVKAAGLIDGETYNRQVDALGQKYGQQVGVLKSIQKQLQDFVDSAKDAGKVIGDAIVGAFDKASDAVGEFVKTGKFDVNSLITDIIVDFAKIGAKQYIFAPLAGALSGLLGGIGGGGGGGGLLQALISHEGGLAGDGGSRMVDPSLFLGARRYHTGGLVGDEIPAILRKRERVLSPEQTRAYDKGMMGGGPTVIFNVKDAASLRQSRTQMAADAGRIIGAGRRAS